MTDPTPDPAPDPIPDPIPDPTPDPTPDPIQVEADRVAALYAQAAPLICRDVTALAPAFQRLVYAGLGELQAEGVDVVVMETTRSDELEAIYFEIGTTKAPDAKHSWHGFALAIDLGSKERGENAWGDPVWKQRVVRTFKALGCAWGGDWVSFKDEPHFQFPGLKASPSEESRMLYADGGLKAVWAAVGAAV